MKVCSPHAGRNVYCQHAPAEARYNAFDAREATEHMLNLLTCGVSDSCDLKELFDDPIKLTASEDFAKAVSASQCVTLQTDI